MRRMLNATSAMPEKYKNDGFSGRVPRTLPRIESPPQSVTATYEMMDMENITKASVISRAAVADRSKAGKRFDNVLKGNLQIQRRTRVAEKYNFCMNRKVHLRLIHQITGSLGGASHPQHRRPAAVFQAWAWAGYYFG
jgi:hypothetical protein